ncbi:MAG TPA: DNA (cytosine-5-)-methyltransferase, partial [Bacilli bacterium]|nr:DNA (cytosine-5-)-methyltransferase [Bacilli bacterium]
MEKTVVELFAGVGGFRVGLNNITAIDETGKAIEHKTFDFVWANQWEPSTKAQHAFDCYNLRFPSKTENSNVDISKVDKNTIPNHTLLCGGFPCQDYSVARSLSGAQGIEGKKGVLWWQINDILTVKRPPFVLLENVDRLIKSPAKQRGRDLGVMLRCFYDLGYALEWRVINAADYGHPQRRRRVFIFAYHQSNSYYK